MARMLRPTRLTDAHGPITCTRHNRERAATRPATWVLSRVLAAGSSDTVTLVSEVDTRSTDRPWSLNTWKASARNPTWCHIPGLSMEMSVMPFFEQTAFTCAPPMLLSAESTVPGRSGAWVAYTCSGMPYCRAGRMQRGGSTLAPLVG